jgi:hypothetical protein
MGQLLKTLDHVFLLIEHAPLHSVILHAMVRIKQLVQKSSVVGHHYLCTVRYLLLISIEHSIVVQRQLIL